MKNIQPYIHKVQYYETDKMGITHHSNYVRWMEEARVDFLSQIGWDYARLEEVGVISPVVGIDVKYKGSTVFSESVSIRVRILECKGVRLKISYLMTNAEGKTVCEAVSEHCCLNTEGRPISIQKTQPEFFDALVAQIGDPKE